MKIVQILPDLNGGGVEKGTLEIAQALVSAGHESLVISAGGSMVAELEQQGSQHITWDLGKKSLFTLRHIWSLRRWIKAEQADVIHVRSRLPAWITYLALRGIAKTSRPRYITTVHGLYSVSRYSEIMCSGETVIAVSNTVKEYISHNYPRLDLNKVAVIHRGVDPQEFRYGYQPRAEWLQQWQQDYPNSVGKNILCLPGRLTRLKGHHDFIKLVQALKQQGQNIHGLIVGGEDPKRKEYAQELYRTIKELGLEQDISFTGARKDIADIYSICALVFSLSTKPESFGRTVLEALRQGISVVGYNHGGVGEILAKLYPDGRVEKNNAEQLLQTSQSLLNKPIQVEASELFLKQTMIDKTLAIYGKQHD